MEYLWY